MISPNFSIGASVHIDYGSLNLGNGAESGYGIGAQFGAIYKNGPFSIGAVYVMPHKINHDNVANFDGDGSMDSLTLESPETLGFGIAVEPIERVLLFEANAKWIDWGSADGYKDFGWRDQLVLNIGAQYKPIPKLALRLGYNYGVNPVSQTRNFNGGNKWRFLYFIGVLSGGG